MRLTPEKIIEIIKQETDIDITEKTCKRTYTDLRSIYYYLCFKYCDYYTMSDIARKVNREHSNAIQMKNKLSERLNSMGFENITYTTKKLSEIIERDFKDDSGVKLIYETQSLSNLQLLQELKLLRRNNIHLSDKISMLKNKLHAKKFDNTI